MSERTSLTNGMADMEIRTVEALDEPDVYAGWTVVEFGDDGSVLIESKSGVRERVKVIGTVEMAAEIISLRKRVAELEAFVEAEPCDCYDEYGNKLSDPCERCKLLKKAGGGDV